MLFCFSDNDHDAIVSIASFCLRGTGSKTHYEYEVRICTCDDRWSILRRYSRFRDLHLAMKSKYGQKVTFCYSFFLVLIQKEPDIADEL